MRHLLLALAIAAGLILPAARGQAEMPTLVTKTSAYNVANTVERLQAAIAKRGATVFATIDHAAGAKSVGMDMEPSTLVVFGNPKLGTPFMLRKPIAGLDLPMHVLVWREGNLVNIGYWTPARIVETYGVKVDKDLLKSLTDAMAAITDEAANP